MKRKIIVIAAALSVCMLFAAVTGCSAPSGGAVAPQAAASSTASSYGRALMDAPMPATAEAAYEMGGYDAVAYDVAYEEAEAPMSENISTGGGIMGGAGSAIRPSTENRKIIYTADVSLQTKDFEGGVTVIERLTDEFGGFIQSSSVQGYNLYDKGYQRGRYAYYSVRVPDSKLQFFLTSLESDFNIGSSSLYSEDISLNYFDTQAKLDSLKIQQERLLEMLERAEEVEYLIEVQKELSRVVYEIESHTSSINRMDDSVNFSTVNLSVEEVVDYTEPEPVTATFGEQISRTFSGAWKGFVNFCRNFVLGIVGITPFLCFAVPAAVIVTILLRRRKKRRAQRNTQPAEQPVSPQNPADEEK